MKLAPAGGVKFLISNILTQISNRLRNFNHHNSFVFFTTKTYKNVKIKCKCSKNYQFFVNFTKEHKNIFKMCYRCNWHLAKGRRKIIQYIEDLQFSQVFEKIEVKVKIQKFSNLKKNIKKSQYLTYLMSKIQNTNKKPITKCIRLSVLQPVDENVLLETKQ